MIETVTGIVVGIILLEIKRRRGKKIPTHPNYQVCMMKGGSCAPSRTVRINTNDELEIEQQELIRKAFNPTEIVKKYEYITLIELETGRCIFKCKINNSIN